MAGKIISVSPGGLPDVSLEENKEVWEKLNALNHKDIMIEPTYFKTAREIVKGDEDLPEYMLDGTKGDFSDFQKLTFITEEMNAFMLLQNTLKRQWRNIRLHIKSSWVKECVIVIHF